MCDGYQPLEQKYELSRKALLLLQKYRRPVHVLTKSRLVERDLDLLREINADTRAMVSFSFSTTDEKVARFFEPGLPAPAQRLAVISKMKRAGIATGVFLMPLLPYASDGEKSIRQTLIDIREAGADFVVMGTMTLKPGRQKDYYMDKVRTHSQKLGDRTALLYADESKWGGARADYNDYATRLVARLAKELRLPRRIPVGLCRPVLDAHNRVLVVLQQLDALCAMDGQSSCYGYAASQLATQSAAIDAMGAEALGDVPGVTPSMVALICEIVATGSCAVYENLL